MTHRDFEMQHKPFTVKKRIVNKQGDNIGCFVATDNASVLEPQSARVMLENYNNGYDYIIEKGKNTSKLMVIHRLSDKGMTYYFRCIADNAINNNFDELDAEVMPDEFCDR